MPATWLCALCCHKCKTGKEKVFAMQVAVYAKQNESIVSHDNELLAIVHFVKHFGHYLYGKPFLIRTDHSSLRWLLNKRDSEGQLARLIETLNSKFNIDQIKFTQMQML